MEHQKLGLRGWLLILRNSKGSITVNIHCMNWLAFRHSTSCTIMVRQYLTYQILSLSLSCAVCIHYMFGKFMTGNKTFVIHLHVCADLSSNKRSKIYMYSECTKLICRWVVMWEPRVPLTQARVMCGKSDFSDYLVAYVILSKLIYETKNLRQNKM